MAVNRNPWRETIVLDACRVCSNSFCCRSHRDAHEVKEHGKIASCVQTLPEICQKCNTFVNNLDDIENNCIKIIHKKLSVLCEHSPNIIIDRPRKRTYSMMSSSQQPLNLKQDSPNRNKRKKRQARKTISKNIKISSTTETDPMQDSSETSPKFEEIKSSSTPITSDQQDLRIRLLKSKIALPSKGTETVNTSTRSLSPHCEKRNNLNSKNPETLLKNLSLKVCPSTPEDEVEKSIYGTPSYGYLTPFVKGRKNIGRFSNGSSTDDSIYTTPKSGPISKHNVVISYISDQEFCTNDLQPNPQNFAPSEEDNLKKKSSSISPEANNYGDQLEKTRTTLRENLSKGSWQSESCENVVTEEKMQPCTESNEEVNTDESNNKLKLNYHSLESMSSFRSSKNNSESKEIENPIEVTVEGKLPTVSSNAPENVKADSISSSCSYIKTEGDVEARPSRFEFGEKFEKNTEKMSVQSDEQCSAFVKPSKKVLNDSDGESYQAERPKNLQNAPASTSENFKEDSTAGLQSTPIRNTNSELVPKKKELLSDTIHQRVGERTPDSITEEITKHPTFNDHRYYFRLISNTTAKNLELLKVEEKVSNICSSSSNETDLGISGIRKFKPNPIIADSGSSGENKENSEITEQFDKNGSNCKSIQAKIDSIHMKQKHISQGNITTVSTDYADYEFHTPFPHGRDLNSLSNQNSEWKSFDQADSGSVQSLVERLENVDSPTVLSSIENISEASNKSVLVDSKKRNNSLNQLRKGNFEERLFKGDSKSPSAISDYYLSDCRAVGKNGSASHFEHNLADEELFPNRVLKYSLDASEANPSCSFEDSRFKMVAYHSTPMVRPHPHNQTSTSLDEGLLNCTGSRQESSSVSLASKTGIFGLAKKRIKSYFPYLFKSKIRKMSKSTEGLHSSSASLEYDDAEDSDVTKIQLNLKNNKRTGDLHFSTRQSTSLLSADTEVLGVADIKPIDDSHISENSPANSQRILKRRPIWLWPKPRRPIHEHGPRVRDYNSEDVQES